MNRLTVKSDVTVTIDIQRPIPKVGFGKPLIIGSHTTEHPYTTYKSLTAVAEDFADTTAVYKMAQALLSQGENSPAEIAIMLHVDSGTLQDLLPKIFTKDWYFLLSTTNESADVIAIADAVEADNTREFMTRVTTKSNLTAIKAKKYERTTVFYHTDPALYPDAALVGAVGSADVGSVTWKFKTLSGITPLDIDNAELTSIHESGAITYVTKAGDNVTSEGKTVSGEYIDIVHSKDYLISSIQYAVQKLLNRSPKVSYDNTGIAQLEGAVRTVLKRADLQGMIAHDDDGLPIYSTTFKPRSQVSPADREKREYNEGAFEFELAGAIHATKIVGSIKL